MIKFSFQVSFSWGNRWFPRRKPSVSCKENNKKIAECAELAMEELSRRRAKSTIDNYQTALRSLLAYTRKDIRVEDINTALMEGYQRWLQMRGVSRNTSSCYMRSLRALLHHINPKADYKETFRSVFTGNEKTEKRAIREEEIMSLLPTSHLWGGESLPQHAYTNKPTPNPSQKEGDKKDSKRGEIGENSKKAAVERARDYFLFSYCAMGMPFIDLAFLRKAQVKNGYIEYRRHKTGQRIKVKIEPLMQQIINRYARENSYYLFPILSCSDERLAMREYERKRSKYNRLLGQLAKKTMLPHLTSYVARHSWASIAYSNNVALPIISKAMGHSSTQTTLVYISEINDHKIEEANKRMISPLLDRQRQNEATA
ncbi:Phage integrase, N-terminal SAM-like domain [Prevotellaceae bacterium HUN156]|nr:Phage integrase, N-terminal SAM-like domain [Prevotellaceae bacterium HUN156]